MLDQESKDYIEDVIKEAIGIAGQTDVDKGCNDNMKPLYIAYTKMQADLKGALKDSKNPFFKSDYADLESVIGVARQPMADNGLAFSQTPDKTGTLLVTKIVHESGAFLKGFFPITPEKKGPQGFMSALTYARRGALSSMIGIHATDDDGNEANDRKPGTTVDDGKNEITPPQKKGKFSKDIDKATKEVREIVDKGKPKLSSGKANQLQKRLTALNGEANEKFKQELGVATASDLRADEFARATKFITQLERNK